MEDLESRLGNIDTLDIKDSLIAQLANREYRRAANPNNPQYKSNLIPAIIGFTERYAPVDESFGSNLSSRVNKGEAKKIYYGLVSMGLPGDGLKQIMKNLSDWEKVYFFAGVWTNRSMSGINSKSTTGIVRDYIKSGIDLLHKKHMIKLATGTYKRDLKLPHSQNYRANARLKAGFQRCLGNEDGTYEPEERTPEERTAIFLDSCTQSQLKYLTNEFGKERLGGYALE